MARNSKIILANGINIDKEYKNVLNYTEAQLLSLVEANAVYQANNYSFIRESETISVSATYGTCITCTYMAFQNPDYSNKWFFAWITDAKYINNNTTEISFKIDSWSTWFNSLTINQSFVEREHVNNDTVGLHTLPENVDTGEFICSKSEYMDTSISELQQFSIIIAITADYDISLETPVFGGVFSGTRYLAFDATNAVKYLKNVAEAGNSNMIVSIFMYPTKLIETTQYTFPITNIQCGIVKSNIGAKHIDINLGTKPQTLGSYTPKNKKLLTSPYQYMLVNNGVGGTKKYNFEDFSTNNIEFMIISTISPSGSTMYYPYNYKESNNNVNYNQTETFAVAKYPICSWTNDSYTNWLTQSGANRLFSTIGSIGQIATGGASALIGGPSGALIGTEMIASGISSIKDNIMEKRQHQFSPQELQGNESLGDVNFAWNRCVPTYNFMHIKEEYARIIDEYFSRFGYQINRVKTPNITGRRNWNYIKISSADEFGSGNVPSKYMDEINMIAHNGTTIWHNHSNIGNYSLDNSII